MIFKWGFCGPVVGETIAFEALFCSVLTIQLKSLLPAMQPKYRALGCIISGLKTCALVSFRAYLWFQSNFGK